MSDQASGQSVAQAAPTANDLAAMFSKAVPYGDVTPAEVKQPSGQAATDEGESGSNADPVESTGESNAQVEGAPAKFKVPALEGDGDEELTADELKAQRLMHRDYTQKTQAIAEARKELEAERAKVTQVIAGKAQEMETQLTMLGSALQSFEQSVNWEALRSVDPAAYLEAREQHAARQQAFVQSAQRLEAVRQEQAQQVQAMNAQRLVEAIPTWLDKATAQKEANEIRQFATQVYGYTDDDVNSIVDYRHIVALRDAAKYHALQKKAGETKATLQQAPKLAQPGAPRQGNADALQAHRTLNKARAEPSVQNLQDAIARFYK